MQFQTDRMVASPLVSSDLDLLCSMHGNLAVMATLGGVRSRIETQKYMTENLEQWDKFGYGLWIFREKETGKFVGRAGLRQVEIEGPAEIELAYAIDSDFWGKGLATEMGEAILSLGKKALEIESVIAFTLPSNTASRRVMEKLGFSFKKEFTYKGFGHVLYRRTL
jgi:RimJ/RimL family protein N-acetyltransferase